MVRIAVYFVALTIALCHCDSAVAIDKEQVAKLAKELKNKDPKIRLKAAEQLAKAGKQAAPAAKELCDAMTDSNPKVALAAFTALETVRPDLYEPLSKLVLDAKDEKRAEGITELRKLGQDAKPVNFFLAFWLHSSAINDARPRFPNLAEREVFKTLSELALNDVDVAAVMMELAISPASVKLREAALKYLVEWAGKDKDRRKEVVPVLKSLLDDPALCVAAIELSGEYGATAKELLPNLKKFKLSSNTATRDAATKAVKEIEAHIKQ